jgi:hypothetical protein
MLLRCGTRGEQKRQQTDESECDFGGSCNDAPSLAPAPRLIAAELLIPTKFLTRDLDSLDEIGRESRVKHQKISEPFKGSELS